MSEETTTYDAAAPAEASNTTTAGPSAGYRPPPRYRTITAPAGSMWDGHETGSPPLWATVRSNLTGGELDRLRWLRSGGGAPSADAGTDVALFDAMAPYV